MMRVVAIGKNLIPDDSYLPGVMAHGSNVDKKRPPEAIVVQRG
jgi:hypothetical protein